MGGATGARAPLSLQQAVVNKLLSLTTSRSVEPDNAQPLEREWDSTKSGLWTLDWTMDWTLDNNGPNIWTRISLARGQRSCQINQLQSVVWAYRLCTGEIIPPVLEEMLLIYHFWCSNLAQSMCSLKSRWVLMDWLTEPEFVSIKAVKVHQCRVCNIEWQHQGLLDIGPACRKYLGNGHACAFWPWPWALLLLIIYIPVSIMTVGIDFDSKFCSLQMIYSKLCC